MAVFHAGVKGKRKTVAIKVISIAKSITLAFFTSILLLAGPPADYAGAEACAKCHPSEFKLQSSSAHARALARSTPKQPREWAFGAGEQAITFVSRPDPEHYREEGKSWYRKLNGYSLTPGAATPAGTTYRIFDPSGAILRCFS